MRGSISVKGFSGVSLWYPSSTAANVVRISSSVFFDAPWRPSMGRNQSRIPVSKSISVPTTSNVSVLKSRSFISSPRASSRSGYDSTRTLTGRNRATPVARFPQHERNFREPPRHEVRRPPLPRASRGHKGIKGHKEGVGPLSRPTPSQTLLGYGSRSLRSPFFCLALPFLWSELPSLLSFLSPVRAPPPSLSRPLALSIAPSSLSLPPLPPSRPIRLLLSVRSPFVAAPRPCP